MHIDKDINFNLNPGDVGGLFPGSYNVVPVEPHELTADEYKAQLRNYELILVLIDRLANDGVDENYIIKAYQLVRDNHTSQKGKRRVPSDKGRELIITLYDTIAQYRDDVMQTRDFGPYPSEAVYDLRCAMLDIIKMYDEYCAAIRDLIVPPTPQQSPTASPSGSVDSVTKASKSNETARTHESKGKMKEKFHIDNVDADELSSYFNKEFKGIGGHFNYIPRLVEDIKQLTYQKEMVMLAVMIHSSPYYNKRHRTFAGWLRAFCKIVNQPCPRDMHPNKYRPSELMRNSFYYLHND